MLSFLVGVEFSGQCLDSSLRGVQGVLESMDLFGCAVRERGEDGMDAAAHEVAAGGVGKVFSSG